MGCERTYNAWFCMLIFSIVCPGNIKAEMSFLWHSKLDKIMLTKTPLPRQHRHAQTDKNTIT